MELIEGILTRQSTAALIDPAPSPTVLDRAFQCAMAAPDHGRLRPWRFLVIAGEARYKFGKILAETLKRRQPSVSAALLALEEGRGLRAPLIIAAAAVPTANGKIPEIEQTLAVGAAVQNLCLALHSEGFGTIWRTGPAAYDQDVIAALGFPSSSRLVGFVYTGTPAQPVRNADRPSPKPYVGELA